MRPPVVRPLGIVFALAAAASVRAADRSVEVRLSRVTIAIDIANELPAGYGVDPFVTITGGANGPAAGYSIVDESTTTFAAESEEATPATTCVDLVVAVNAGGTSRDLPMP